MISCGCYDYQPDEPGAEWHYHPESFVKFDKPRRKRCLSCGVLINRGEDCLRFPRERNPWTDIEEKIKGEIVSISPVWMCGECGETYLNLTAAGWCVAVGSMREALEEYHDLTGFKPQKQEVNKIEKPM